MLHDVKLLLLNYDKFKSFSVHMTLKVLFNMTNTHYYLQTLNGFF